MLITQGSVRNCGHAEIVPIRGCRGHRRRLRETALSLSFGQPASFMTPITKEALHGLFLFMPSELPVCYSYLAGKQHPVAHLICWLLLYVTVGRGERRRCSVQHRCLRRGQLGDPRGAGKPVEARVYCASDQEHEAGRVL